MRFLLFPLLLALLAGCAPLRIIWLPLRGSDGTTATDVHVVTCGDLTALAAAVVDGRRRGQSRAEQRLFVGTGSAAAAFHLGLVDSVYNWPRPVTEAGWAHLLEQAVTASSAHCLNRPAAALRGEVYR